MFHARKTVEDSKVILLDLITRCAALLADAKKIIKDHSNIKYAFADVNCCLELRFRGGALCFFSIVKKSFRLFFKRSLFDLELISLKQFLRYSFA